MHQCFTGLRQTIQEIRSEGNGWLIDLALSERSCREALFARYDTCAMDSYGRTSARCSSSQYAL